MQHDELRAADLADEVLAQQVEHAHLRVEDSLGIRAPDGDLMFLPQFGELGTGRDQVGHQCLDIGFGAAAADRRPQVRDVRT